MGGLMTYGYAGDVYLLTTITPPKGDLPKHFEIKANAQWLVCKEECIPGKAELTVAMDSGMLNLRLPQENKELFEEAKARMPGPTTGLHALAKYGKDSLTISIVPISDIPTGLPSDAYFFPEQPNVLSALPKDTSKPEANATNAKGETYGLTLHIKLQQNGDKPSRLSGVLVSDHPFFSNSKAIYLSEFDACFRGSRRCP